MSLILEALRRSEAERQLGRAPDLLTPMPALHAPRHVRPWPWWLALALSLAVVLGWVGWRYAAHESQSRQAAVTTAPGTITTPGTIPAPATRISPQPRPTITADTTDRAATAAPEPMSQGRPVVAVPASRVATPPAAESITHAPKATEADRPARIASAHLTAAPVMSAPIPRAPIATAATSIAATPDTHPVTAPGIANAAPASVETLPSIADLAPAERASLPALKVSMHVWAELPGDRFMIVDGARVGEGARIGDRIVLVRIRRDGGVLDIGGRRYLLPKP